MANLRKVNPVYCPAHKDMNECMNSSNIYKYIGYSESKYRLHISLAHPRDCPFAHVQ